MILNYDETEKADISIINQIKLGKYYYDINNNIDKSIVLFGNCHMFPIGFFLDYLLNMKYNIIIINSWIFDKLLNELKINQTEYDNISNILRDIIIKSDILIYQKHFTNYLGFANNVENIVVNKKFCIPNIQLMYKNDISFLAHSKYSTNFIQAYNFSHDKLTKSIEDSDFINLLFILNNLENEFFFRTPMHPTHYLLFIISDLIRSKIINEPIQEDISYYYTHKNIYYDKIKKINTLIRLPNSKYFLTIEEKKISKLKYEENLKDDKIDVY